MGYSGPSSAFLAERKKKEDALKQLESHPNYKELKPKKGDSILDYTCRYLANLISPPQDIGESYDVECVTIKVGIIESKTKIQQNWKEFIDKNTKEEIG